LNHGSFRRLELGEPAHPGLAGGERGAQLRLGRCVLYSLRDAEVHGERGEPAKLVVRTEDENINAGDHPRDRLVGDPLERLPAELVEVQVAAVAEVGELEVVLPNPIEAAEQLVPCG
jgi:hypothetical protein